MTTACRERGQAEKDKNSILRCGMAHFSFGNRRGRQVPAAQSVEKKKEKRAIINYVEQRGEGRPAAVRGRILKTRVGRGT